MAENHQDYLDYFDKGWAAIEEWVQDDWAEDGKKEGNKAELPDWVDGATMLEPWPTYLHRRSRRIAEIEHYEYFRTRLQLVDALMGKMEYEGKLQGLPPMPITSGPKKGGILPPQLSGSAFTAVDMYLKLEQNKAIERMLSKIEEEGIDAMLSYFKENEVSWP
jgi:hypothetical protein